MPRLSTRPRAVLFDLDGTITDPAAGITRCLAHALQVSGLDPWPYEELRLAIGPPWETFFTDKGIAEADVANVLAAYREEYGAGGLFEATVFEGMPELLADLAADGYEIALATSKPSGPAKRIIEHFGVAQHFTFIGAATPDGRRSHKADVIAHVLANLGHCEAVMVGDRKYDVEGARAHGLPCIVVPWGHTEPGEIAAANPAAIASSAAHVREILNALPSA